MYQKTLVDYIHYRYGLTAKLHHREPPNEQSFDFDVYFSATFCEINSPTMAACSTSEIPSG